VSISFSKNKSFCLLLILSVSENLLLQDLIRSSSEIKSLQTVWFVQLERCLFNETTWFLCYVSAFKHAINDLRNVHLSTEAYEQIRKNPLFFKLNCLESVDRKIYSMFLKAGCNDFSDFQYRL